MRPTDIYNKFVVNLYWCAAVIITIIAVFLPKGEDVLWINGHHSPILDEIFKQITNLGQGWIFIPVFIFSLFVRYSLSASILVMAILHGLLCSLAKRVLFPDSPRPTAVLDNSLLHFIPGVEVHAQHSFPSGHTATIFCFAVLTSILIRHRLGSIMLLFVAVAVGYSRIYLLQHFLLDVAAGAIVGISSALLILYAVDRITLPGFWSSSIIRTRLRKT